VQQTWVDPRQKVKPPSCSPMCRQHSLSQQPSSSLPSEQLVQPVGHLGHFLHFFFFSWPRRRRGRASPAKAPAPPRARPSPRRGARLPRSESSWSAARIDCRPTSPLRLASSVHSRLDDTGCCPIVALGISTASPVPASCVACARTVAEPKLTVPDRAVRGLDRLIAEILHLQVG
jgi:hypothetical protein